MKTVAYLISAYTEPESLQNLVNALDNENVDFYIHIDKKVDENNFSCLIANKKNVYFVPTSLRVKVYWGGYSQVVLQRNLIKYMLSKYIDYKRVVNLTGTDYPIVSNKILQDKFMNLDKEFIIGFDINHEEYKKGSYRPPHQDRIIYYYMMDNNKYIRGIVKRLKIRKAKSCDDLGMNFYYGSEYWALTYDCLKDIINEYDNNTQLQKILKHSFAPSESWIHTVFFCSKRADKGVKYCDWDHRELHMLSPLVYFHYKGCVKILEIDDYNRIIESEKMFARKIIKGKSDDLISKIDQTR